MNPRRPALLLAVFLASCALNAQQVTQRERPKLTETGEKFVDFVHQMQRNVGFGSPRVSLAVTAQLLGVKHIPADWGYEQIRTRVEHDLQKNNIQVVKGCTEGNCGALAISANVKCGSGELCVYSVSSQFLVQCKPLRLPGQEPVFAAVWSASPWDYGIVSRTNLASIFSIIDELADSFSLYYYKPGEGN
jgi:hypothetical protein